MPIRRTRSISGDGDTLSFDDLAQLVNEVHDTMEQNDFLDATVTVKQWPSSGADTYGHVDAGFRIEVTW